MTESYQRTKNAIQDAWEHTPLEDREALIDAERFANNGITADEWLALRIRLIGECSHIDDPVRRLRALRDARAYLWDHAPEGLVWDQSVMAKPIVEAMDAVWDTSPNEEATAVLREDGGQWTRLAATQPPLFTD